MGSVKRAVKAVATGGYSEYKRQKDKEKQAEREVKNQEAEFEAQENRDKALNDQQANRTRQESADLGALAEQSDRNSDEMAGILTTVEGLVPGDRKLNKKKTLGG